MISSVHRARQSIAKQRYWDHVATAEDRAARAELMRTNKPSGSATRRYYGTRNWRCPAGYEARFAELRAGGLNVEQARRAIEMLIRAETQKVPNATD